VNPYFTIAGHYRAIVSGTGPLGTTTAQVDFTLLDISQLRAAFTPSLYGGVASMQVCFTDNSIGMNIQSWNWDFGNGDTLNYTSSTIPGSICTLYTNPSTTYTVTLVVSNGILTDSASNQVRTYSLLESSSTFSITPNGGGQYCFYANLTGNVNVTGWDFGDTGTAGALDTVCHTYSSSGTFVVRMSVTNSNGETGTVIRTVVVNIGGAGNPALTANGTCSAAREATFTVSNAGAAMTTPDQITIRDLNGAVIQIDNLLLAAGGSQTFTVTNQSGSVTFSSADFRLAAATTCEYPPEIAVVAACNSGLPTFTVSNTNGPMITAQSYEVRDSGSTLITSGTFQLARGDAPVTISVPAGNNPYDTYTFASNGAIGTFQINQLCGVPDFDVAGICSRSDLFTITNTALDMPAAQPYHVTDGSGAEVLSGNFQLNNGETLTVPSGMLNPYATYTLTSSGLSGDINIVRPACERPVLAVMTTCNTFSALTITNAGSDMLIGQTFRITTSSGTDITPTNNTLQLNAYESRTIALSSDALSEGIIFESDGYSAALDATMECGTPISTRSSQPSGRSPLGGSNSLPAWDSAPTCGFSCPPFRLYHTDETGDWEIFRLDGANKSTRESIRENLSYGVGPGVVDMSPSLSPDNQWIVFSSNRDGNWEIYVASTSGDPTSVERVTYNTVAIDTDPTWGPNNYVVYETTRNGTWDLYMVDMATGQEYRLTDDASNDINPYWSADGAKLVFQSDREGDQWQIYELDLLTMTVTKLSDGTTIAVDPQYADNNAQIVYRTYTNDNANSVITVMNADGQNVRTVSDPAGNATNSVWSPGSRFIAYQSDLDGDLDIYVVEVATGLTRQITNNTIADYAPSWLCSDTRILFTSEIEGDPNIYEVDVQPLTNPAVLVEEDAEQMTFETANDIYPQDSPNEENASREGRTVLGTFGEQTTFLQPDTNITPVDLSIDDTQRQEWNEINACPAP
jgi:Tol biopolymer transport system component